MALSLRKTSDRGSIGLDIDGRYLAAAQVGGRARHPRREPGAARGPHARRRGLGPRGARPAPEELRFGRQPAAQRAAGGGQPADRRPRRRAARASRTTEQRDAAVRFQASEAIAMPLDEAVLDHQVAGFTTAADGTARMQVVIVAARRKMIETLLESVKAAGLKVEGVDLDAFALVRTLAVEGEEPDESARVFCHLGGVIEPRRRRRRQLLLHPSAVRRLGRGGRRLAARRRDPPVDRLLHDPAAGEARRRGRALGPGLRRRRARRGPRDPPGHPRDRCPRRSACSTARCSAPTRIRTATRWRRASRSERPREARQPDPAGPAPARRHRRRRQRRADRAGRARRAARDGRRVRPDEQHDHRAPERLQGRQRRGRQARGAGQPAGQLHRLRARSPRPGRSRSPASPPRASTGSASCASWRT